MRRPRTKGGQPRRVVRLIESHRHHKLRHAGREPLRQRADATVVHDRRTMRLRVPRAKEGRGQVHRGGGHRMRLLEHTGRQAERMPDQHRAARLVQLTQAVVGHLEPCCHLPEHQAEPAARVPDIGVPRHGVEVFRRGGGIKLQPRLVHHAFERGTRGDHHVVTTGLERTADADERMDVAARSHRGHDETHRARS